MGFNGHCHCHFHLGCWCSLVRPPTVEVAVRGVRFLSKPLTSFTVPPLPWQPGLDAVLTAMVVPSYRLYHSRLGPSTIFPHVATIQGYLSDWFKHPWRWCHGTSHQNQESDQVSWPCPLVLSLCCPRTNPLPHPTCCREFDQCWLLASSSAKPSPSMALSWPLSLPTLSRCVSWPIDS